jgi:hypothetical protein
MSDAAVQGILQQIERLSDEDRLSFSMQLASQEESQWQREADRARVVARQQGMTQAVIDQAIDEIRHPT